MRTGNLDGTFDPNVHVVEALVDADKRTRRTKGRPADTFAQAYRVYPTASGPVLRIASHAERGSIPGLAS